MNLLSYVLQAAGKDYDGFEAYLKRQEQRAADDSAAALEAFEKVRRSNIARDFAKVWRGYRVRDAIRRLVHTVEEEGLPEEWDKLYTNEGQDYYFNPRSKRTVWVLPSVSRYWDTLRLMGVVTGNGAVTGGGWECAGVWRGRSPRPPPGGAFNRRGEFLLARLRFEDEKGNEGSDEGEDEEGGSDGDADDGNDPRLGEADRREPGPASGAGADETLSGGVSSASSFRGKREQRAEYTKEPPVFGDDDAEHDPSAWELIPHQPEDGS